MKPLHRAVGALLVCSFALLLLTGCGSFLRLSEERIYREKIDAFFSALEAEDAAALKSLFSEAVVEKNGDLDAQAKKLLSVYPNAKTEIKFDGMQNGSYEKKDGKHRSAAQATFPVVCGDDCYWVYFELVYEDDFERENVGLRRVFFYTADEYYVFRHTDGAKRPDRTGLLVFSDRKAEKEVRPINQYPRAFTPSDRKISVSEAEEFLKTSRSIAEFTEAFGMPNAKEHQTLYYELTEADGTAVYLELQTEGREVAVSAHLVGPFEYIRCLFRAPEP